MAAEGTTSAARSDAGATLYLVYAFGGLVAATGILIDADRDTVTLLGAAVWVLGCVLPFKWLAEGGTRRRFQLPAFAAMLFAANLWDVPSKGVSWDEVRREAIWLLVVTIIFVVVVLSERRKQHRQHASGGTA